jgi:glycosyltransferase involved in cell wall biosynthesis
VSGRRRVLLLQASIQPPGGGASVAAWTIQALKDEHDVTICTVTPVDLAAVNRFYGTSIGAGEVTLLRAPVRLARLLELLPLPLSLLKATLLWRRVAAAAPDHDVLISGNNEADFGRAGIQYVHYPWSLRPRPAVDLRWYHVEPLLALYYRLCDRLARFSPERVAMNVSLVNSDWTGALMRRRYGVPTRTVYPPVDGAFPDVPWEARGDEFVCIGRISPEKEIERVIDIVAAVREHAPGVRLNIVGTRGRGRYQRRILRRLRECAGWITLHEDLPRDRRRAHDARPPTELHSMRAEHNGIAVAEMVMAGAIPFIPAGGGQVEIVGGDERFLYRTVEEAVAKIRRTLADAGEQSRLRAALAERRPLFSAQRFMATMRAIVASFPRAGGRA